MVKQETQLAVDLLATEENIVLDHHIKVVLANKVILSRILKECVDEFSDMNYDEIESCIEGTPEIGIVPMFLD